MTNITTTTTTTTTTTKQEANLHFLRISKKEKKNPQMLAALPSTPASGSYGLNVSQKKIHSSLVDSLDVRDSRR